MKTVESITNLSSLNIHVCKKSRNKLVLKIEMDWYHYFQIQKNYLLFSATSIWFSRSPLSVVSACSIFQLRFSISASNWACWYSNWNDQYIDNVMEQIHKDWPIVSWDLVPCNMHMDMCTAECIYISLTVWQNQTSIASQSRSRCLTSLSPAKIERLDQKVSNNASNFTYCDSVFDFFQCHSL